MEDGVPVKIDFSQFHPLDHSLARCYGYPGGWRTHLQYRWEFQWREDLVTRWMHLTGRHNWLAYASRSVLGTLGEIGKPPDPTDPGWTYGVSCAGCEAKPDPMTRRAVIARDFQIEEAP
jgi:hypothetical protein